MRQRIESLEQFRALQAEYMAAREAEKRKILVCCGTGCVAGGNLNVYHELKKRMDELGIPCEVSLTEHHDDSVGLKKSGCHGFCEMGPLVRIEPEGWLYTKCQVSDVEEIIQKTILGGQFIERLGYNRGGELYERQEDIPFYKRQTRRVLEHCGHIDAESIEEYLSIGGYGALAKALFEMQPDEIVQVVSDSGLRGRGGAGFPTHVKLAANTIDTLLINAAECEPYLTTDCREMLECSDTIISGITAVMKYCEIPHCIIGIERNKPECIDLLTSLTREMKGVEVKGLPMRYPQGAEKTLVETCTGREVPQIGPSGKPGLPADVGCVIMNVTSVSTLGKFLKTGIPLVTKRVTVEGDAIARPQNIEVPIGTLYRDVIDACGGVKEGVELGKIIFGGPMMGGAAPSADFPVLKQNNGLLLFSKKAAALPEPSACIRCGRCIEACPMGLEPVVIAQNFANKDFAALKARCVDLCVACGSCTYACPAKRPVSQTMGLAKGWYMAELRKGGK